MRLRRTIGALAGVALMPGVAQAAAQADTQTEHNTVGFSETFVGPCGGSIGVITVEGQEVLHLTDTGKTFQLHSNLHGSFNVDFDDPAVADLSGHFVSHHYENVNYDQLKDWRVTDSTRAVAFADDGTIIPTQITTTVLYSADGSVEVKIDSVRCGGQIVQ